MFGNEWEKKCINIQSKTTFCHLHTVLQITKQFEFNFIDVTLPFFMCFWCE